MKPLTIFFVLAIIFIDACKPSANDHEKDNANDIVLKGTIDVKTAKRLVKNFEPRSFHRNDVIGFFDTRCIWFSVGQLDSLIQKIKHEKGDGVRFYLAAYDRDSAVHNKSNFRDHTTLVMVSTAPGAKGKHVDYYDSTHHRSGAIITTTPENQGELCPPPATCADDGATLFEP